MELQSSYELLITSLQESDLVLDVGGWSRPFPRADWVIDLKPYETRGEFARQFGDEHQTGIERFGPDTWVQRDICDREPWPFVDRQFNFAVCAQTLEDVRDPVWVCSELVRVARAGYIEVPTRLLEQSMNVQGPWVGFGHHHWLVDIADGGMEFVFKHHVIHGRPSCHFPAGFGSSLPAELRAQCLWWEESFEFKERYIESGEELDDYLGAFVAEHMSSPSGSPGRGAGARALRTARRAVDRLR